MPMKPELVVSLIEDLRADGFESSVGTGSDSCAHVEILTTKSAFTLTREECELVLHSPQTVRSFYEAMDSPKEASIELHELTVDPNTLEALERCFAAVDET